VIALGDSFGFVTRGPGWVARFALGSAIALGALLTLVAVVGLLGWCVLAGYYLEVTRRAYVADEVELPEWNQLGSYCVRGLALNAGLLVWALPLLIVASVLGGLLGNSALSPNVIVALSALLIGAPALLLLLLYPLLAARYALSNQLAGLFAVRTVLREARGGLATLVLVAVTLVVLLAIALSGFIVMCIGIAVTLHYAGLVGAHALGLAYREIRPPAATAERV
jgi:hypothetical protein